MQLTSVVVAIYLHNVYIVLIYPAVIIIIVTTLFLIAFLSHSQRFSVSWFKAYVRELGMMLRLYSWSMVYFPKLKLKQTSQTEVIIVPVHGFLCNSGLWKQWSGFFNAQERWQVTGLNVPAWYWDTPNNGQVVLNQLSQLKLSYPETPIVVIGHSMGGLAARIAQQKINVDVICLATPHEGTFLAPLVSFGENGPARKGMQWLKRLNSRPNKILLNVSTKADEIVLPWESSQIKGEMELGLSAFGHMSVLSSQRVQQGVKQQIQHIIER